MSRPHARYYMSGGRDAIIAVVATDDGWSIEDHVAAHPGTGEGRALRQQVLPTILRSADTAGIPISLTAATDHLAEQYMAEIPGLTDVGRGRPRGRQLYRPADPGEPV